MGCIVVAGDHGLSRCRGSVVLCHLGNFPTSDYTIRFRFANCFFPPLLRPRHRRPHCAVHRGRFHQVNEVLPLVFNHVNLYLPIPNIPNDDGWRSIAGVDRLAGFTEEGFQFIFFL